MIRRDPGEACADKLGSLHVQRPFEINVIEMHQRQESGVAAALSNVQGEVQTLELIGQKARGQSFNPLIEITHQYARTGQILIDLSG